MLSECTRRLATKANRLTLIARDIPKLLETKDAIANCAKAQVVSANYYDRERLFNKVFQAVNRFGKVDLALAWIHTPAVKALGTVGAVLNDTVDAPIPFIDVLGSQYLDSEYLRNQRLEQMNPFENLQYKRVILGCKIAAKESRWLTHHEISKGVYESILSEKEESLVGDFFAPEERSLPVSA